MAHLDRLEADISDGETEVLTGAHEAYLDRIIAWRQELLRLKRYYEQLDSIFDELAENDNSLLGKQNTRRFANLGNRMERYLNAVQSLRESAQSSPSDPIEKVACPSKIRGPYYQQSSAPNLQRPQFYRRQVRQLALDYSCSVDLKS